MLAVNPGLTNDQLQRLIEQTADKGTALGDPNDNPVSWNQYYGYGRINACRALDTILSISGTGTISSYTPQVQLYPDPFNDKANLEITNFNPEKNTTVTIYDALGRELKQYSIKGKQTEISRAGMVDGLYFYQVKSASDILGKGKFVITE
jgi:hypothetical protein